MKTTRRIVQFGFLALTVVGVFVVKGNAERWCPFGGVEAIYSYATEGNMLCSLGVSNFYILAAVLLSTLLLRRVFCGYMCPIGTVSEWLQSGARRIGVRALRVPGALDRVLGLLKYPVLAFILFITYRAGELLFREFDPCYALLSRHGEDITFWAYVVSGVIVVGSLVITIPFCRWLCPLAAVLNPFSRFGLTTVKRDTKLCTDCGVCSRACPMNIPVAERDRVDEARCISCLGCLEVCRTSATDALSWGPPKTLARSWPQAALIAIMLFCISGAVATTYAFPIPSFVQTFDQTRGTQPERTATLPMEVNNLSCRGNSTLFAFFIDRDDLYEIDGYLKIEAWPGPSPAQVLITYDPAMTDEGEIKQAITESYFDSEAGFWRHSPFDIEGYDPLDDDD